MSEVRLAKRYVLSFDPGPGAPRPRATTYKTEAAARAAFEAVHPDLRPYAEVWERGAGGAVLVVSGMRQT